MDGPGPLLTRLRTALAPFDDEALASLANRGLVRRARKDLESSVPKLLEESGGRLHCQVDDAQVELTLPPAQSSCTCPASGICRHILAALIFVRETIATGSETSDERAEVGAVASPFEEILGVVDEALARWASKARVSRASNALATGLPVEIEEAGTVVFRFPTRNVTCRWMPGGGLEGMICSCHAAGACEHRVWAVLAFQAQRGRRTLSELEALEAASDAPRTREEVRNSVSSLLREMVIVGTSRLSRSAAERTRTLAVSAHGVELPRLERVLQTLAVEIDLILARDAQADQVRLLDVASRAEALCRALERPTPTLVGQHRSAYEPVGDIELIGLGARRWRAKSGYAGLTVYFWDRSAGAWATWTDARPTSTRGLDPIARYLGLGPWSGQTSPSQASRAVLRLTGAWRSRQGRISGRPSTQVFAKGPSVPAEARPIDRWSRLVEPAGRVFGGGFGDRDERDAIVLLAPSAWGRARYDPTRQELGCWLFDRDARVLPLVLAHSDENAGAIDRLETLTPSPSATVLGLLRLDSGRLSVEPIAIHQEFGSINLTLDAPGDQRGRAELPPIEPESDPIELDRLEENEPGPSSTVLGAFLGRLSTLLGAIAEGGFASFRELDTLRLAIARSDSLGLSACARASRAVEGHLAGQRAGEGIDESRAAADLLRACYLIRLAIAEEAVAAAAEPLGAFGPALDPALTPRLDPRSPADRA